MIFARQVLTLIKTAIEVWHFLYLVLQRLWDRAMSLGYTSLWSLDSYTKTLSHLPRHIVFVGDTSTMYKELRSRHYQNLARAVAGMVDGGIRLFTIFQSRALWHYEDANELLLKLTTELKLIGYEPFVSFANRSYDSNCFSLGSSSYCSDDPLRTPLNVLILSPIVKSGNLSRADIVVQLIDRRNAHELYCMHLGMHRGKPFNFSDMMEGFSGLRSDTSGNFSGYPDLIIIFSRHRHSCVRGLPPWLLRKGLIFIRQPCHQYYINSLVRDLVTYNKICQQKHDTLNNL